MDTEFSLKLETIKYIQKNENKILFELSNQQFYIIVPKNKDEFFFVDIPVIMTGFAWLSKINEYIFDKKPDLQGLVTHIEKKFSEVDKSKLSTTNKKTDIFNVPDLEIDKFDLDERKYRRQLEQVISTKKSKLNLNANDNASSSSALFSGKVPGVLIMNEFFELRKKYSKNSNVEVNYNVSVVSIKKEENIFIVSSKKASFKAKNIIITT
ncbi:MAG: NAD(P)-binding domain-containing protein, partial [Nitrososphaeraceae archaeon]|nr:NAD(P)-binding domain-containing protein [Nitrososphaeraceae archaeon]